MISSIEKLFDNYYNVLGKLGYIGQRETNTLLVSSFLMHYMMHKSSGISIQELRLIKRIFDCLGGTSCLSLDMPTGETSFISFTTQGDSSDSLFIIAPDGKLPTENINNNKIYLVPRLDEKGDPTNIYVEYFYTNNRWETLGESNSISNDTIDDIIKDII